MAKIYLRDYLAAVSVKTTNADLDKVTILDSSDGNAIKTILKEDLVDINEIVVQLQDDFVRFGDGVVSSSSQINITQTQNYTASIQYTDSNVKTKLNSENVLSSSAQIDVTQATNYSSINQYSDSKVKDKLNTETVISGSDQITALGFSTTDNELTTEEVQDIVGGMLGGTETGITVTYQDGTGDIDFVVSSQTDENFTTDDHSKLDGIEAGADITDSENVVPILNANTVISGSAQIEALGYSTTDNELTTEEVQDIVGGMVSGNTESGISVTYDDDGNSLDFSVTSQTENDFTTILKDKLDGIEGSADVTDNDNVHPILDAKEVLSGSISSSNITDVDAFSQSGTYSGLRAQSTTKDDVGLGNVDNESKATMFTSPEFTSNPTAPTQLETDDSTKIATTQFVQARITDIIGNAGSTLDTLGELSASLAEDSGSLSTLTTTVGTKLAKSSNLSDLTDVSIARANLGVLSGSSEIDITLTTNYSSINQYTDSDNTSHLNSLGVVSGSSQIDVTQTTNYGSINQYTDSDNLSYLNSLLVVSKSANGDLDVNGSITASTLQLSEYPNANVIISTTNPVNSSGELLSNNWLISKKNTFIGQSAYNLISGSDNIGIGSNLFGLAGNNRSDDNIALGRSAGSGIVTGSYNIAIGAQALQSADDESNGNVAIGNLALFRAKGDYNTAVGHSAAYNAGFQTTAIGGFAGFGLNENARFNTAVGYASVAGAASYNSSTGDHNTGTGYRSLEDVTSGQQNVGFGGYSLSNVTTGNGNTSIGFSAGSNLTTGSYNTLLGYDAEPVGQYDNNSIVIGKGARGKGSNTTVIGNDDTTTTYLYGKLNLSLGNPGQNLVIDTGTDNETGASFSTLATSNILLGRLTGDKIVAGDYNIGIGSSALGTISNEGSDSNIAIGFSALSSLTSGSGNIAIGHIASLNAEPSTNGSISIGYAAGQFADSDNISIGYHAGKYMSGGGNGNVAIGAYVGRSLSNGATTQWNTGVGAYSLGGLSTTFYTGTAQFNAAFGGKALSQIVNGTRNVALGVNTLYRTTNGHRNTVVGNAAGTDIEGDDNTLIGYWAGISSTSDNLASGSGNTLLGSRTLTQASDDYNSIVIGSGSIGNGSNTVVIGNDDITSTELKGSLAIGTGRLSNDNQNLIIKNITSDKDISFVGKDDATDITALTLDMSEGGKATFSGKVEIESATSSAAKTTGALVVAGGIGVGGAVTADFMRVIRSNPKMMVSCNDTTITAGQVIGSYQFSHSDNDGGFNGSIFSIDLVAKDDFTGFGSTPAEYQFDTHINVDGDITGSSAQFAGNVGIGTNNPDGTFHLYGTSTATTSTGAEQLLIIENSANGDTGLYGIGFRAQGGNTQAGINAFNTTSGGANANLQFWTRNSSSVYSERMRITADGEVKIGDAATVDANGLSIEKTGNHIFLRATSATAGEYWNFDVNSNNRLSIINDNNDGVYIDDAATSWTGTSDERLKTINYELTGSLENLEDIRAVNYSWVSGSTDKNFIGLIAQDVEQHYPEMISEDKFGYKGIRYTEMIPVLVSAIKEQQSIIDDLKSRIETLENS